MAEKITAAEIILVYICPSLGMVMANLMFLAPMKDLQSAVRKGSGLGDLNPTPWAFMLGNCLGWSAYGVLISNWFVFWANYPGFLIACWLNLGAVKLMYSSHHKNETRRSVVEYLEAEASTLAIVMEEQSQSLYFDENNANNEDDNYNDNDNDNDNDTDGDNIKDQIKNLDATFTTASSAHGRAGPIPNDATSRPKQKQYDWMKIVLNVTSQTTPAKAPHEKLVMGMVILWSLVVSGIGFAKHYVSVNDDWSSEDFDVIAQSIVGYIVNLNLVFFYGAPLSAINRVLKTKRSDALHVPTMITNTCNSTFWTAYAIAVNDPFIYVPNGLGVVLGTIQFLLWMIFPKTNKWSVHNGGADSKDQNNETANGDIQNDNNSNDDLFLLRSAESVPRKHPAKAVGMDGSVTVP